MVVSNSSGQDVGLGGLGVAYSKSGIYDVLSSGWVLGFIGCPECWFQDRRMFIMCKHVLLDLYQLGCELTSGFKSVWWIPHGLLLKIEKRSCQCCAETCASGHLYFQYEGADGPVGSRLSIKIVFISYGIPMLKIRRSRGRLIFNMGIPIPVRRHLFTGTVPRLTSCGNLFRWHTCFIITFASQVKISFSLFQKCGIKTGMSICVFEKLAKFAVTVCIGIWRVLVETYVYTGCNSVTTLAARIRNLETAMNTGKITIVLVKETHLEKGKQISIKGYGWIERPRPNNKEGGVGIP